MRIAAAALLTCLALAAAARPAAAVDTSVSWDAPDLTSVRANINDPCFAVTMAMAAVAPSAGMNAVVDVGRAVAIRPAIARSLCEAVDAGA